MLKAKRHFSWQLTRFAEHPDFKIASNIYTHTALGSKLIHLKSPDPLKAFGLLFRTKSENDKGLPHSLERLCLCGSQNYPIKDPFSKMGSRSLNSYMNSWTGSDFTMFPFSTQNTKDFSNLLNLYLDSAFFPLLKLSDFKKEIWRIDTNQEKIQFQGNLYGDMKTAANDPDNFLLHFINRFLFEGTSYQYNSGGDFLAIPTMKYEELIDYHKKFYHPSNATFFFYGDLDIQKHINELEEHALNKFTKQEIDSEIKLAPRRQHPLEMTARIPMGWKPIDPNRPSQFSMTFLCNEISKDPYLTFCMGILSSLLLEGPGTPFYKSLLESGLGRNYIAGSGYDTTTKEATFTFGVTGMNDADSRKVENAILKTLQVCMNEEFDLNMIESTLHQIEIRNKEIKPNYGLLLISSMIPYALHGEDPLPPLYINKYINRLREELAQGIPVFQNLIREQLWNNQHKLILTSHLDPKLMKNWLEEEKNNIEKLEIVKEENKEEEEIDEGSLEKVNTQNTEIQALNSLPTLLPTDVGIEVEKIEYAKTHEINGIPLKFILQPTNGITYIRIKFDVIDLPVDLGGLFPLYTELVSKLGTSKYPYETFEKMKELYTISGLNLDPFISCDLNTIDRHTEQLLLEIGSLDHNLHNAFDILSDFLIQPNFNDYERLTSEIQKSTKKRADGLNRDGLAYAISLSASSITSAANSYEKLQTLNHDCNLASLIQNSLSTKKVIDDVIFRLKQIHSFLMQKGRISILIHSSDLSQSAEIIERFELLTNALSIEYPKFNEKIEKITLERFEPFLYQIYFTLPMQVNHVVETYMGTSLLNKDYPALLVLSELMTLNILNHELREKGGAYDAGCRVNPSNGTITIFSHRDPNNLKVYNAFEKSIQAYSSGEFGDNKIDEAKLATFAKVDKPLPAYQKGLAMFINNVTNEMRQSMREQILEVKRDDLIRVNHDYLMKPLEKGLSSRIIFGVEKVEKTVLREAGWIVQRPIEIVSDKLNAES
ncbi:PITRM1_1 [Blepharisma stoltei]|uniref:Peptidase M16C associated domain-containing protein n=1 Tax=Blepharisma stoltei TaxID=1481888 RepID=A0AAU9JXG8_9CILI|nr:unnamed protein product [Blepharisma stoltei]